MQKKEMLCELLGLTEIELAYESINTEFKQIECKVESTKQSLEFIKSNIGTINYTQQDYLKVEQDQIQAQNELVQIQTKLSSLTTDNTAINELRQKANTLQATIKEINKAKQDSMIASSENQTIKRQVITLNEEINVLKANICPTCKQKFDKGQDLIDRKSADINSLLERMQANIGKIKEYEDVCMGVNSMQEAYDNTLKQIGEFNSPISDLQNSVRVAENNLSNIKYNLSNIKNAMQQKLNNQNKALDLQNEIDTNNKKLNELKYAAQLISREGFLSVIFDEILKDIQNRSNELIVEIPNISNYSLIIDSTSITQKGTTKKGITTKLLFNGKEINIKSVSGGQICALELCTDLAVAEAIKRRSGSNLGWVVMDEAMDNLDLPNKKAAIGVIRNKIQGQIIIIDHMTEIQSGIEKNIEVIFDGNSSSVI